MSDPRTAPAPAPTAVSAPKGPSIWIILPLLLFLALAGVFLYQLSGGGARTELPSTMIGRPVPELPLTAIPGLTRDGAPVASFTTADLKGAVTVINVWASWCGPCRQEHPVLVDLARDSRFRLYGINQKDEPENARRFLGQLGNPYAAIGADRSGRAGIELGVYGVPETFVVDRAGRIVHKHVGPLSPELVATKLMPKIEQALAAK